jgi:hypothetical protein
VRVCRLIGKCLSEALIAKLILRACPSPPRLAAKRARRAVHSRGAPLSASLIVMAKQLDLQFVSLTPVERWHDEGHAGTFSDWMDWRMRDWCPLFCPCGSGHLHSRVIAGGVRRWSSAWS